MSSQLFATKSITGPQQHEPSRNRFKRTLSAAGLTTLGVGGIIGTGIFVLMGTAAANHAGPALALSFIIAGLGCALAGLCYAELASMIPVSGSAYSYSYATLGEAIAWFVGWNLILEYLFAVATVSVGWSGYVLSLLAQMNIHLPSGLTHAPFDRGAGHFNIVATGAVVNLPAVLIVLVVGSVCYLGVHQSSLLNSIVVAIKVAVVVLFILLGVSFVSADNWHPFIPPNTGEFGQFGWSGVMAAAGVIFFAYIGFDAISTCAQEANDPQRDMPRGILLSLGICTVLYVATAAVLTGMVSYRELNVAAPVALALDKYPQLRWLGLPVKIGAVAGMTSVILVMTLAQAAVAVLVRTSTAAISNTFGRHNCNGCLCGIDRWAVPRACSRGARVDRYANGLCHRVRRCPGIAQDAARHTAAFSRAIAVAYLPRWSAGLWSDDGNAAG
jgi:APA family basic amino acid/polyamine antiporter